MSGSPGRCRRLSVAALLAGAAAFPAWAGDEGADTRAGRWRALREAKRERLELPRAGWLERTLLALEKAERPRILDFEVAGVYPRAHAIGWGSKQAAGVRLWHPDLGASPIDVHGSAFWSVRGYAYYDVQAGLLAHDGERMPLRSTRDDDVYELGDVRARGHRVVAYGSVRHRKLTGLHFFGLGADTAGRDRTNFLLRDTDYEVITGYRPNPRVGLFARAGLLAVDTGPGRDEELPSIETRFDDATAPGLDRQPDFLHAGVSLLLDGRDEPGNPHRGAMLALSATRYDDRDGGVFSFVRLAADARAFVPLGSPARVLALRGLVISDDPGEDSRVPFYMQETLGGSRTLRGFPSFRFRGERLALVQAEYRWEAAPAVELALFWEGGAVRRAEEGLRLSDMETDYGIGLRVKSYDSVLFRLDVARSDEQTRALVRFSHSF